MELHGAERDRYLWKLRQMDVFYLERENNMERNRKLMLEMGLKDIAHFFGTKRKCKDGEGGSRKKPRKDNEEWSSEEDDNESEGEGEGDGNGDGDDEERTPVKTRASVRREPAAEGTGKGKGKAGAK
jgi:hypothetical protein